MKIYDVLALTIIWSGVIGLAIAVNDALVGLIALCLGYYLSKFIILKRS